MSADADLGLHPKFFVARLDEEGDLKEDKPGARYFVLDYGNDPHARVALSAYAESVHRENYTLACDLRAELIALGRADRLPPIDGPPS